MNFFCKLLPPRASFAQDMTPAEAQLMQEHATYWRDWMARGHVVVFGLVGDPRGAYGMGIVDFPSEAEARAFTDGDPTIRSGLGFEFEVLPMPFGAVRP
jgi:YCII-related domain